MALEVFKLMGTIALNKEQCLRDIKAVQDQAEKASRGMKASFTKFSGYIDSHAAQFRKAGMVMTVIGGVITTISTKLVKMASDAEETSSKFVTVFSDVSDEAQKTAKNLSKSFGLSSIEAKKLLGDTGDLLIGFGFSGKAALDLAKKVNELAVDLASFTNYSGGATGASAALTKALLGERESLKTLGIAILDADVKAKVLELTQKGLTFETDRQATAFATLLLAQEQSEKAMGDFERTSGSFANQMRILKAEISDVAYALAEKLLPMATELVGRTREIVQNINEWIERNPVLTEAITKWGTAIGGVMLILGPVVMLLPSFVKNLGLIGGWLTTLATKFGLLAGALGLTAPMLLGIIGLFTLVTKAVYGWIEAIGEAKNIREMEAGAAEAQEEALEKLRIAYNLSDTEMQKCRKNLEEEKSVLEGVREPTYELAKATGELAGKIGDVAKEAGKTSKAIKIYAEDVAENYIELSIKAIESWEDFYRFWEAEAKRTSRIVEEVVAPKPKPMYKKITPEGEIIGIQSQHILSQEEVAAGVTLVPMFKGGLIKILMGEMKRLAQGGSTDVVPIMATPGEYLIKKEMVDFIRRTGMVTGGLVEAIKKGLPTPSPAWTGGVVTPSGIGQRGRASWIYPREINFNVGPINIEGDGDAGKIKAAIKEALEESADELDLSGNEIGV